mmetsp:Transcript_23230/g.36332  ORF Transcript_23230/g.36332 Transcript_23230/m.36332 type:complete len:285 (+) Transcript_23230:466-1320(+)|eukprot:CAMPEP_0184300364 /NCGR_PEP_ID=MMETSP1049-20130417/10791_1 /TAXON_ID=77928 /ORGANISM="Proteomonas sulcata, Strain CCMP704" /LENGTH=284 /DNA_ID=CAMNT_0026611063 /DNA_START=485 /DNA_END=1339 /DNA_ORIENTATION=+
MVSRCEQTLKEKRYYEAMLQYKALFARYSGKDSWIQGVMVLRTAAMTMNWHQRCQEGLEFGLMIIEFFRTVMPKTLELEFYHDCFVISESFDKRNSQARAAQLEFLTAALNFSREANPKSAGNPQINRLLAIHYKDAGNVALAHSHFAMGDNHEKFVDALMTWSASAPAHEKQLFVARAVLQSICAERLKLAEDVLVHCQDKGMLTPPYRDGPMMNFCNLLIKSCEKKERALFEMLQKEYAMTIRTDPLFEEYMHKIGEIHFVEEPPVSGMQRLLRSLFGTSQS